MSQFDELLAEMEGVGFTYKETGTGMVETFGGPREAQYYHLKGSRLNSKGEPLEVVGGYIKVYRSKTENVREAFLFALDRETRDLEEEG